VSGIPADVEYHAVPVGELPKRGWHLVLLGNEGWDIYYSVNDEEQ